MRVIIFIGLKLYEIFKWPVLVVGYILAGSIVLGLLGIPGRYFCIWFNDLIDFKPVVENFVLAFTWKCYAQLIYYGFYSIVYLMFLVLGIAVIICIYAVIVEGGPNMVHFFRKWIKDNWEKAGELNKKWRKK